MKTSSVPEDADPWAFSTRHEKRDETQSHESLRQKALHKPGNVTFSLEAPIVAQSRVFLPFVLPKRAAIVAQGSQVFKNTDRDEMLQFSRSRSFSDGGTQNASGEPESGKGGCSRCDMASLCKYVCKSSISVEIERS